ncbi:SH3 domain-containing protein [Cellulosimicrobium marinum]|uniref:SH3 domain-containing protein n=1 Tax=Cellulosimicrobium marinum TaxID=1638992 RepID=UPI001E4299AA|nr:SH3 domain-containing protein [Cellulosimicrobium marinum]MCB7138172.1 SH3 domain-containing protein [Cellulosimicrobium marinum]
MPRGRHSAAPTPRVRSARTARRPAPAVRSMRLPALAMVTLIGAGVLGSGPQAADGSESELEPLARSASGPAAEREAAAASRSGARSALGAPTATRSAAPAPATEQVAEPAPDPVPEVIPAAEAEPTPEPVPVPTGKMWTTDAVNVRSGPSADAEKVTTTASGTAVDVTGATEGGYRQVVWDGAAAWISADFLADSEPVAQPAAPAGPSGAACGVSAGIESGLRANAIAVYRAVCAAFPQVGSYGGLRPGDSGDHGSGRAVDVMVSGAAGWDIANYVQANAGALGVTYVIYEQRIWHAGTPAGAWEWMEDRGGATANHYDHVHVSTS